MRGLGCVISLLMVAVSSTNSFAREPAAACVPRLPIPDKLAVLTFDDSVKSHFTIARPLLKKYGFGATFFITEGFNFHTNKTAYMTWDEIRTLHEDGFEIGNHTRDHLGIIPRTVARLEEQLQGIDKACEAQDIPRPVSFAWPGNAVCPEALPILKRHGIKFARRGTEPDYPYKPGLGRAYEPRSDHPLLLPTAGDARPDWTAEQFRAALSRAGNGRIVVLQFHGVPEGEHPWVNTPAERFEEYMQILCCEGFTVIALRDLAKYVDPDAGPENGFDAMLERAKRKSAPAAD